MVITVVELDWCIVLFLLSSTQSFLLTSIFCPMIIILTDPISQSINFSSNRRSPTMRPQQDFFRSFCSCCCPPLFLCSFLEPLGLLSHYPATSLVVFVCFLLPPLVRTVLLPEIYFPPSLLCAQTMSAFFI